MIELIIGEIWPYVLGALVFLGALFGYGRQKKSEGRREAEQEQAHATAEQRRKTNEADTKLAQMDDDDIRRELRKWVRPTDAEDR